MYSAYPPSKKKPVMSWFLQMTKSPARQASQTPQCPPCQPTPTRWPGFQAVPDESVRMTDAAGFDGDAHLRASRLGDGSLDKLERRSGLGDLDGSHRPGHGGRLLSWMKHLSMQMAAARSTGVVRFRDRRRLILVPLRSVRCLSSALARKLLKARAWKSFS
jgi:hypothetical protein